MEFNITKDQILEAADQSIEARQLLQELFPAAFEKTIREKANLIICGGQLLYLGDRKPLWMKALSGGMTATDHNKIPGTTDEDKADAVILALAEAFNWGVRL